MISYEIERLIAFGLNNKLIEQYDIIPVRNALLDLLGVQEPYNGEKVTYTNETATEILEKITQRDDFASKIMGLLMPRQSEMIRRFYDDYNTSPVLATDEFYKLSRASNYILVDRVAKNIFWTSKTEFGDLEITINLSKPEKDPKDIALAKSAAQTNYPKCLICAENAGFAGTPTHPARYNHRTIPLTLHGEQWHFQYSPYVYYNEHCIVLDSIHRPMKIEQGTFYRLFDFVQQFPHYFIGANADLPIVGGSILTHDHFQGGRYVFPMEKAESYKFYTHKKYKNIKISLVKWPMSVVRIAGENKDELIELGTHIFQGWKGYSDPAAQVVEYTQNTPHNTITPIVRKKTNTLFEMDIVLRNNRTTNEHPLGIFHPHANLHHIKKENIGLIEVMGLAVLPGRLKEEFESIKEILQSQTTFDRRSLEDVTHTLNKHLDWITYLTTQYGTRCTPKEAKSILEAETGKIFCQVLSDAGVFKYNNQGIQHFDRFMTALSFEEIC